MSVDSFRARRTVTRVQARIGTLMSCHFTCRVYESSWLGATGDIVFLWANCEVLRISSLITAHVMSQGSPSVSVYNHTLIILRYTLTAQGMCLTHWLSVTVDSEPHENPEALSVREETRLSRLDPSAIERERVGRGAGGGGRECVRDQSCPLHALVSR